MLESNPTSAVAGSNYGVHYIEPGQKPEFTEYTVVLKGMLRVKTVEKQLDIHAGEAIIVKANEWVQYSTPDDEGAEYIAVCLPSFSPDTVHRDDV